MSSAAKRSRWKFSRVLVIRRWRIVTHFRAYHGNGSPNFEFEFRLGAPRHSPKLVRQLEQSRRLP